MFVYTFVYIFSNRAIEVLKFFDWYTNPQIFGTQPSTQGGKSLQDSRFKMVVE